jgi:glycosyltransferase involved in cell wall biosynthesis
VKTVIVIPALNEASTIAGVVDSVRGHGELLVVDDGSTDATAVCAAAAGASVVRHPHNRGYDAAIDTGFRRAADIGADIVATFDADGQHDPTGLARVLTPLLQGEADLAFGIRPAPARLAEALVNRYARFRFGVDDILCGLKAYRMRLYLAHGRIDRRKSIGTELALAALRRGARAATVPVAVKPRGDHPRIGSAVRANARILRALVYAIWDDVRGLLFRPGESGGGQWRKDR